MIFTLEDGDGSITPGAAFVSLFLTVPFRLSKVIEKPYPTNQTLGSLVCAIPSPAAFLYATLLPEGTDWLWQPSHPLPGSSHQHSGYLPLEARGPDMPPAADTPWTMDFGERSPQ